MLQVYHLWSCSSLSQDHGTALPITHTIKLLGQDKSQLKVWRLQPRCRPRPPRGGRPAGRSPLRSPLGGRGLLRLLQPSPRPPRLTQRGGVGDLTLVVFADGNTVHPTQAKHAPMMLNSPAAACTASGGRRPSCSSGQPPLPTPGPRDRGHRLVTRLLSRDCGTA